MFHRKGRSWACDLEPGSLQMLLESVLQNGGITAQVSWDQAGQLGTSWLLHEWPEILTAPAAAFLRRNPRKPFGLELSVDLEGDLQVQEYGEDLRRFLMGEQPLEEVQSCVAVEEPIRAAKPMAKQVFEKSKPQARPPQPSVQPTSPPLKQAQPVEQTPPPVEQDPAPTDSASRPVEVIAPGMRVASPRGRSWSQAPDDLFGLAGEVHPDDQIDHGLEITAADLPWLNPGDSIISPRRGPCRIKRVEDEARQVVAKDENKQMIVITFRELLAEFTFDDGN
jgi:hypothetical protein